MEVPSQDGPMCVRTCSCVCWHIWLHKHPPWVCFSNANLTRGLCAAAMARPTSTTVSCIEMPASLDPKSRSIMMDTAKVRSTLTAFQLQPWGARKLSSVAWTTRVLSTLTTAPKAVETTWVLGGVPSWCSGACWVHPGCPTPLPRVSCIRFPDRLPAQSAAG